MSPSSDSRRKAIFQAIEEQGVGFVHLQFTDVPGAIKSVTIPASRLARALEEGVWFDGSAVEGLARVAENDLYLRPDLASFALLPWEPRPTARLICDLCRPDGSPFPADPRHALKAALAEAAELGFDYKVGCEVEFFVFESPGHDGPGLALEPIDSSGYFEVPEDRAAALCYTAAQALKGFGVEVETTHHEVAPGQHEIDLAELDAVAMADAVVTLKWALRAFGRREGLLVTFMPKPLEGMAGSGMHVQQVLIDRRTGANAFFDPAGEHQLSRVARGFIAGQLAHARGMCAVLSPLVNSYKRLMGGAEAPGRISWARINRGAFIRFPEVAAKTGTRIELRASDPSCNPYLALAVMLSAGLDGIKNDLPLRAPVEEIDGLDEAAEEAAADPLPEMLGEALEELDWDPVVRAALGQPIYERFVAAKTQEWIAYRRHISQWELRNYLTSS